MWQGTIKSHYLDTSAEGNILPWKRKRLSRARRDLSSPLPTLAYAVPGMTLPSPLLLGKDGLMKKVRYIRLKDDIGLKNIHTARNALRLSDATDGGTINRTRCTYC
jgi:hypothetical protein